MSRLLARRVFRIQGDLKTCTQLGFIPVRRLNLLEYQSKELLKDCGVSVQNFAIVEESSKTNSALEKLRECVNLYIFRIFIRFLCIVKGLSIYRC